MGTVERDRLNGWYSEPTTKSAPKHLQWYCGESVYRYNTHKVKDIERFFGAFNQTNGRLKYNQQIDQICENNKGANRPLLVLIF